MKHTTLRLSVLSALGIPALSLFANLTQANELSTIVVSASPVHQHTAFEVPSQVEHLQGEDKSHLESGSLGEMLEEMVGVNNQKTGSQSGKPVIRGLTSNRVKVMSNGMTTDYQAYGTRHNPNVDAFLAEQVEVIRGASSVLYGSEAMGGVVNILSPQFLSEDGLAGEVRTEYNSNNAETQIGSKLKARSGNWMLNLGGSLREGDNFRTGEAIEWQTGEDNDRALFTGEVPFTNFENQAANVGLGYESGWGQVAVNYSDWQSKQNYLNIEGTPPEAVGAGQLLKNQETQVSGEFFVAEEWVLKPKWSHTRNTREATHDEPFETMAAEKGTDHYLDILVVRDDIKLGIEHPEVAGFKGEVGMEWSQKDQTLKSGHLTPTAKANSQAIYVFEEADINKWVVQFGARYDQINIEAPLDGQGNDEFSHVFDASNNERDFSVFTSSFGTTYKFNSNWSAALNLAQGFRAPTIFELYAGGTHGGVQAYQLGNPDLTAETSLNTDVSLRWQTQQAGATATVYNNQIDDFIYLERTDNNVDEEGVTCTAGTAGCYDEMQNQQTNARIQGFELSGWAQWTPKIKTWAALELIDGRDLQGKRDLPLMPANNLRVKAEYALGNLGVLEHNKLGVQGKFVAAKKSAGLYEPFSQFDSTDFGSASTDAYQLWDVEYTANLPIDHYDLGLQLKVENLFGTAYRDFLDTYKGYTLGMGRNIKLSAKIAF
ncbi:TonB-dependent receptor [Thiomicrospira pelophila]|uniref:TonB-dependent receptor n=1 Tax=Thiomicrospira pelophila TaxID=934 RepID=UPI0004A74F62|nr:TonB-dependent receptor [Thiomicrospira pelophila]